MPGKHAVWGGKEAMRGRACEGGARRRACCCKSRGMMAGDSASISAQASDSMGQASVQTCGEEQG